MPVSKAANRTSALQAPCCARTRRDTRDAHETGTQAHLACAHDVLQEQVHPRITSGKGAIVRLTALQFHQLTQRSDAVRKPTDHSVRRTHTRAHNRIKAFEKTSNIQIALPFDVPVRSLTATKATSLRRRVCVCAWVCVCFCVYVCVRGFEKNKVDCGTF